MSWLDGLSAGLTAATQGASGYLQGQAQGNERKQKEFMATLELMRQKRLDEQNALREARMNEVADFAQGKQLRAEGAVPSAPLFALKTSLEQQADAAAPQNIPLQQTGTKAPALLSLAPPNMGLSQPRMSQGIVANNPPPQSLEDWATPASAAANIGANIRSTFNVPTLKGPTQSFTTLHNLTPAGRDEEKIKEVERVAQDKAEKENEGNYYALQQLAKQLNFDDPFIKGPYNPSKAPRIKPMLDILAARAQQAATIEATKQTNATGHFDAQQRLAEEKRHNLIMESANQLKSAPANIVTAIQRNRTALAQIDEAIQAVTDFPQAFGLHNKVPLMANRLPDTPGGNLNKGGVPYRSLVSRVASVEVKDLSGTAVSSAELERNAPGIGSVTDPADKIKTNLLQLKKFVQNLTDGLTLYYNPANGFKPVDASPFNVNNSAGSLPKARRKIQQIVDDSTRVRGSNPKP